MSPDVVPFLPRGVRTHHDGVRGADVLLGPERVLILDTVGVAVLGEMNGVASLAEIAARLAKVYDAPLDVIAPDVTEFVQDLRDKGFVHAH